MKVLTVVGNRPQLVKAAAVSGHLRCRADEVLVHTGQHYDRELSEVFFEELGLPPPERNLGVGSGGHAAQTAATMVGLEEAVLEERPDAVLVYGDTNATLAGALVAAKLPVPLAHVEAGMRSFDRSMPEEVNRVLVDQVSELLLTHSPEALDNLVAEGVAPERVHEVGNTMIDTLVALEDRFRSRGAAAAHGLEPGSFLLVTLHRPALVDGALLAPAIDALREVSARMPVVFPVHPRTRKRIEAEGIDAGELHLIEPIGYLDFLSLQGDAGAVLTDSGGIQEESTYLGVPCFTLRDNTERPITVEQGTNTLLGLDPARIAALPDLLDGARRPQPPPLWDGRAAGRAAEAVANCVNHPR
jgi:UDP-N-acetylglucosamine 2-epimerase (non-hydrolysing)